LVNTTIITNQGEVIVIPNNTITVDSFMNYTKNDQIYLLLEASLSANNRINYPELLQLLVQKVRQSTYALNKREVYAVVSDMSGVGTKITIKVKIASADFFDASNDIRLIIRQTLEEENVKLLDNYY
jgi:small-conductance mechanosensitive channel